MNFVIINYIQQEMMALGQFNSQENFNIWA